MYIDVAFLPSELPSDISSRTVIVIDVLRASSTIIFALGNGCRRIIPVEDVEKAREIAKGFSNDVLLGGERGGLKVEGFDLGNSPLEYHAKTVSGKIVVLTTTNGTQAIHVARNSKTLYVGAFLNISALARRILKIGDDVVILCAGRCRTFSLEDSVCAGMLVKRLSELGGKHVKMRDSALAARQLFESLDGDILEVFRMSEHGKLLLSLGMEKDLEFCSSMDACNVVPVWKDESLQPDLVCVWHI